MIIPIEDMNWVNQQKPAVKTLWMECWQADPYGSRWVQLNTSLADRTFRGARKVLTEAGLFLFKPEKSIRDGRETVCWMVVNLHGARTDYWAEEEEPSTPEDGTDDLHNDSIAPISGTFMPPIAPETSNLQGFPDPSRSFQKHFKKDPTVSTDKQHTSEDRKAEGVEILKAQEERLKIYGIYSKRWNLETQQIEPRTEWAKVFKAAISQTAEQVERGINRWIEKARNNQPMNDPYGLLAWCIRGSGTTS